jgi:hypothetical protein
MRQPLPGVAEGKYGYVECYRFCSGDNVDWKSENALRMKCRRLSWSKRSQRARHAVDGRPASDVEPGSEVGKEAVAMI